MKKPKLEKKILVFYHGGCMDGFSAAWVAHQKFGDDAEYIPATHNEMYDVKEKEIYMVDISISDNEEDIKQLTQNNDVTLIDHHVTRKNLVPLFSKSHFSLDKSGAILTWEYFNPNQEPPLFLQYVQDQDLWNWELPHTREIMDVANLSDQSFDVWDKLIADIENESLRNKYIERGAITLSYYDKICDSMIEDMATLVDFEGFKVYAINVPHIFASVIGNKLAIRTDSFGIVWSQDNESIRISLRSISNFDVSAISKKYGGGGHKNSAGIKLSLGTPLPWKVIRENKL